MNKKEERKEKVVELYNLGVKTEEIAKNLNVSVETIYRYIKELKKEGKIKKIDKESRVEELYNSGIGIEEIAKILNVSVGTTIKYIEQLRQKGRVQSRKSINSIAKKENKERIVMLYNSKMKIKTMAESLGVSVGTVNRYIKELREEGKIQTASEREKELKERVLELYNQGLEIKEIAKSLKVPVGSINVCTRKLKKEGIIQSRGLIKNIEKEKAKEKILKLYNSKAGTEEIAKALNISLPTMYRYIRELREEGKFQGIKKKEERKEKTLELYNQGIEVKEIAKRLNVTVETINTYIKELEEEGRVEKRKTLRKTSKKEENKEKILELYNQGLEIKEIAKRLNISDTTIYKYIKELKEEGRIQKRKTLAKKDINKEETLGLYNSKMKVKEIAKKLNVSVVTIRTYIKELKEEGKVQNNGKEERKEEALELYNQGLEIKEIAKRLNVTSVTINTYIKELIEEGRIQERKNLKQRKKEEKKEEVLRLCKQGIKTKEIAKKLNLADSTIHRYIKEIEEERVKRRKTLRKNSKKEGNKEKILELYNQELEIKEIAKKLNLAYSTIHRYIKELGEEGRIQERKNLKQRKREERILELYSQGLEIKEIAKKLNLAYSTVHRYIRELEEEGRVEERKSVRKSVKIERKEKVLELYNQGTEVKEIAMRLDVSVVTIKTYIKELKEEGRVEERKSVRKSIKIERKEKVLEIYNQGIEVKEIAMRLKVSPATVYKYIEELKKEKRIQKRSSDKKRNNNKKSAKKSRNLKKEKTLEKESIDIQKRVNKDTFKEKDYQSFSDYILHCKEMLAEGQLKREELETIKKVANITYKYDDIVFYIKSCIHFGQLLEAKKAVNGARSSGEFLPEQKEKLNELYRKIIEAGKKKAAIIMLKNGRGVLEAAKSSGLSETEVIKLNRKLLAKYKKEKSTGTVDPNR